MPCSVNPFQDPQMSSYFSSLPPFVQESIMQCNPKIQSLEDLERFAQNLMKQGGASHGE